MRWRASRLPAVKRVGGVDRQSQTRHLFPFRPASAGCRAQLVRGRLERPSVLPICVNLEELDANRLATGILGERVSQDLLGLGIAAVGHIDVGFRDRVDLLGVGLGNATLTEIALKRARAGVNVATPGAPQYRIRIRRHDAHDAVLELRIASYAPSVRRATYRQYHCDACATHVVR